MKKILQIALLLSMLLLSACAAGPDRVADAYRQALESGDSSSLEAMSAYKADFESALKNDFVSVSPKSGTASEEKNSGSAYIVSNGVAYRLHKDENSWKIDCSTAGPFNQSTPEMTLLLALHLVKAGRFAELNRLALPDAAVTSGEPSEAALELWREFAAAVGPSYDCRPFEITGDEAILSYGGDGQRQIKMRRSNSLWYIVEIN